MRVFGFMVLALLTACAAPPPVTERVTIAPGISLDLPAPGDLGRSVESVQMVTARHGGDSFIFEGRLSVTPDRLLLAGSDSMGRRAMTVTWTKGRVEIERAAWLPDSLRPENILADMVLLYWPEAVVRQALGDTGLIQTPDGRSVGDVIRVLWQGDPWGGLARLHNSAWDYDLEVRSVMVGP
jgi:hypothetical protein